MCVMGASSPGSVASSWKDCWGPQIDGPSRHQSATGLIGALARSFTAVAEPAAKLRFSLLVVIHLQKGLRLWIAGFALADTSGPRGGETVSPGEGAKQAR